MPTPVQDDFFADALPPSGCSRAPAVPEASPVAPRKSRRGDVALTPAAEHLASLAVQLPKQLRMGASTWSYPGWEGLVWDGAYSKEVLAKKG